MPEYFKFNHDLAHPNRLLGIPFTEMVKIEAKGKKFIMLDESNKENVIRFDHDFYIGAYPVTQALYEHVMGENPSAFYGLQRPVEQVSWNDTMKPGGFKAILNDSVRDDFPDKIFSLPSEAQWLYAASCGISPDFRTAYAGSNDLHDVGWFNQNNDFITMPVGLKQPNEFGLYDMSGNVSEWLNKKYDLSPNSSIDRTIKNSYSTKNTFSEYRGGGYDGSLNDARIGEQSMGYPSGFKFQFLGFRLLFSELKDKQLKSVI